jgi:hypothetical protein
LRQVFDYAKATGKLKGENPASCLVDVLKKAKNEGNLLNDVTKCVAMANLGCELQLT